ncbi:glycosyltransferase family 4 protein [Candidatus Azambacteria bacterium]|nr:glycosyltransferase family 4 protein [Candidatus Azambacteria bacterium]MBI3685195.1 glycosyltransferase family 4 protein [Candidatus Azambacteria bacterium]
MVIGIHAKGAFKYERTGVEEYVFQLIKHFAMLDESKNHIFQLYTSHTHNTLFLPYHFQVKRLYNPLFWTNGRLSLNMLFHPPDVLFMPANFLPLFYPRKNVVTIHGLEFEYYPEAFSPDYLEYLKRGTKKTVDRAHKIIVPSFATRDDLVTFYRADPKKITVIPHGVNPQIAYHHRYPPIDEKYILFIGRLEKKKNVKSIVKAYAILKEKYKVSHKLVLVGAPGFGYDEIQKEIEDTIYKTDIIVTGYISHEEKESFFKYADVFVFPSLYEGFGMMSVLESQLRQVPVVSSNIPSIKEIAGDGAMLVDPHSVAQLTEAVYSVISDDDARKKLVEKGLKNTQKYSWYKCAQQTLATLVS